jgi:4-amino-4-deoxy-L-arabinose transferase-like glycosyltransferase
VPDDQPGDQNVDAGRHGDRFAFRLTLIAALALTLRVTWVIAERRLVPFTDGQFYFGLAGALRDGKGFLNPYAYATTGRVIASANHTPAWPLVLTIPHFLGLSSLLASQIFACLVGTGTVVAVGLAGRSIVGTRMGLLAAALAAAYPNFWVYERELMSETLALLLTAVTVGIAYRYRAHRNLRWSALLGALCGALALTHPNFLLLILFLCFPLVFGMPHAGRRRRLVNVSVAVLTALAVVSPWLAYNATRFSEPVLMTTAMGLTLRDSNCNYAYYGPALGSWGVLCSYPQPKTIDAAKTDAEMRRRALRYIAHHLDRVPIVLAAREGRTWGIFRPFQQTHFDQVIGSALWVERLRLFSYWTLAPLAIAGAVVFRRRRITLVPIAALFALVAVTAALAFGDTRYRAPAEVAIVLLAATAIDAFWRRRRPRATLDPRGGAPATRVRTGAATRRARSAGGSRSVPMNPAGTGAPAAGFRARGSIAPTASRCPPRS